MRTVIERIDTRLEQLGYFIVKNRFKVLVALLLMVAFFLSYLPKTTVDTSTEGFLHQTDPARIAYDKFREQFGRDERMVVAIEAEDIFSFKTLEKLKALHKELQAKVPHLNDMTSLINARNTQGSEHALLVEDLFEHWPQNEADLQKLKQTALANPLYKNVLLSEDAKFSVIVMESNTYSSLGEQNTDEFGGFEDTADNKPQKFLTDQENSEMVQAVQKIVQKYHSEDFKLYFSGSPTVSAFLKSTMMQDMKKFNILIIVTIIIFLSLLFRRVSGVLLPLLTVILGVLLTLSLMAMMGVPIKVVTQIVPSLLLAVGVGASVHMLAIFYKHLDQHENKADAIAHTLAHSGLAVIMTSLTTAAGIASFALSEVAPVADFGLFASLGVLFILAFSLILLPVLLAIFPIKVKSVDKSQLHHDFMDKFLHKTAQFSYEHATKITIISLAFMMTMAFYATSIIYSHNTLTWFPKDHPIRVATQTIDQKMRGSISLEVIVDTHKENGLYDYNLLQDLEHFIAYTLSLKNDRYFIGKAMSITDVMKEIHKALNANDPQFYTIAKDKKLLAQEILLFENSGSDDLEDFVDSAFSKARITIKMPWLDAFEYHDVLEKLKNYTDTHFVNGTSVVITGMIPLLSNTMSAAIESSGSSYMIAFGVITLMMIFLLGSIRLGLISMIPNLFPIFVVLGMMVIFDFSLDMFTMLIGAIVIGMAVDDTVHFMHNFRRSHIASHDTKLSIDQTLRSSGRAMMVTSIVLSVGFYIYMFASLNNIINFGLLTGTAIIAALIADFILAPALMRLYYRNETKENS